MPTYCLLRELCISDLCKVTIIQHLPIFKVGQAVPADHWKSQLLGGLALRERLWLLVHSAAQPGARLFCSGVWIIRISIQALESHAGLLHEPRPLSLSWLSCVHLLMSRVNKLCLAWPLDIFSSLNANSFTFILKLDMGQGLGRITGCVQLHRSHTRGH